jgi:nucleoside-diphosphate-sugar epimerase
VSRSFEPKGVLITGNLGYVGPSVVERLRLTRPNALLIGFDAGYFAHCLTGATAPPERHLDRQYFGDLRAFPAELLSEVDAIVHLAAISNDPIGNAFENVTYAVNCRATSALAARAREAGVRSFVFASSCSVYGFAEDAPRTEASPPAPITAYARSKVQAESDLRALAADDFCVTSLRFGTACGMSDRLRLDLVLNDFVAAAVASGRITLLSDGSAWRPLIHVRDMARAIDWALRRTPESGGPFLAVNAGRDEWNYRVRDLAEAVADVVRGAEISIKGGAQADRRSYRVSFDLFRRLALDYQPQIELNDAVRELRDGLARMNFADENFRGSQLMRLKVIECHQRRGLLSDRLEWIAPNGARSSLL